MSLTVKDILEKTFKRSFKGYDEDEVDKFLDQIIDEFKAVQNENAQLKSELVTLREQANKVKAAEETIMSTMISAQKSSERIVSDATRKAELILSSAESTSRQRADAATKDLADAQMHLQELKSCAQGFATSFANMINSEAAHFEKTYRSYFGQEDTPLSGGINMEALDRIDKDITLSMKDMPQAPLPEETAFIVPPMPEADIEQNDEPEQTLPETEPAAAEATAADGSSGFMELYEINKLLGDIESSEMTNEPDIVETVSDVTPEPPPVSSGDENEFVPKYDDYSWIYDNDEKPESPSSSFKDSKEKEELKSLIDDVLE